MGLYSKCILPRLLDWTMGGEPFQTYRRHLLAEVSGNVLEVGFGTGLNLAYYPETVERLTLVDPNPGMDAIATRRLQSSPLTIDKRTLGGEALPMADNTYDYVVSTWTLCTIPEVEQAIREIWRVLKPGGYFLFIEHGKSPEPKIQTWQNRLTPLQKVIADGCHLNRPIRELVEAQFGRVNIDQFYDDSLPKIGGYMYRGSAVKQT